MSNLDKLKHIWLNLENTYYESGMDSKRAFLEKYLGYRNGTSGLPKLLLMLQRSCEFNEDHEPLPKYKDDYEILTKILNNADKLVQSIEDIENLNLDDIQYIQFEEAHHEEVKLPTFSKQTNSIDIISAIMTKFSNSFYNVQTKKHMVLPCINDNSALIQSVDDYKRIITYLVTKIKCDKSTMFDQLLFRYLVKNNVKPEKYPVNVIFLDTNQFDIIEGNMILKANESVLCFTDNVKVEERTGDKISYSGFMKDFPKYSLYKGKSKNVFDKTFVVIGFKY